MDCSTRYCEKLAALVYGRGTPGYLFYMAAFCWPAYRDCLIRGMTDVHYRGHQSWRQSQYDHSGSQYPGHQHVPEPAPDLDDPDFTPVPTPEPSPDGGGLTIDDVERYLRHVAAVIHAGLAALSAALSHRGGGTPPNFGSPHEASHAAGGGSYDQPSNDCPDYCVRTPTNDCLCDIAFAPTAPVDATHATDFAQVAGFSAFTLDVPFGTSSQLAGLQPWSTYGGF